ncbi:DUF4198 domain-containing protein [Lysobacter pythonis]|uniref:DUF4198 domain-containing protein n=1 Tax=Solilutibacter pythonis TaxID=2483112 RepID=A0A3M2I8M0_9GAMM|nr:DUF4198 domain-containing protein [Lysobacter pythonis]RMH94827.1 DUF4198 domain-containing protein [Lysobacter pythonis]
MKNLAHRLCASLLLLASSGLSAHVPFLKPNQFQVEHPRLHIESAFTELPFQADFAMDSPNFVMVGPDGKRTPLTATARTPAAVYLEPRLAGEGSYRISTGVRKGPNYHAVETAGGKLYFADDMARHRGQPARMQYFSRADAHISQGEANYAPRPFNEGIEIIPLSAPTALTLGDSLRLRVLHDGKPVAHARIVIAEDNEHYRHHRIEDLYDVENIRASNLHADTNGEFTLKPTRAGLIYLLTTSHKKTGPGLWESHNAALTLEVRLPKPE